MMDNFMGLAGLISIIVGYIILAEVFLKPVRNVKMIPVIFVSAVFSYLGWVLLITSFGSFVEYMRFTALLFKTYFVTNIIMTVLARTMFMYINARYWSKGLDFNRPVPLTIISPFLYMLTHGAKYVTYIDVYCRAIWYVLTFRWTNLPDRIRNTNTNPENTLFKMELFAAFNLIFIYAPILYAMVSHKIRNKFGKFEKE